MEENSSEYRVWISSDNIEKCVFCGEVSMGIHMSSCPSNLISLHEGQVQLFTRLHDEDRTEDEYHSDVGKQLMYAADAIIKSQKEWSRKHTLEKMEDVFNNWSCITDFAEVLFDLEIVQTATEVIDYYKNPTMYESEFLIWSEYDFPFFDEGSWFDFRMRVELLHNGDTRTET